MRRISDALRMTGVRAEEAMHRAALDEVFREMAQTEFDPESPEALAREASLRRRFESLLKGSTKD